MLNLLLASFESLWADYIRYPVYILMALCAIFIILVVMFQPGNSSGVSALGGQTETFLGKNKSKTFEHKMKVLTIISAIIFAVISIAVVIIVSTFGN